MCGCAEIFIGACLRLNTLSRAAISMLAAFAQLVSVYYDF